MCIGKVSRRIGKVSRRVPRTPYRRPQKVAVLVLVPVPVPVPVLPYYCATMTPIRHAGRHDDDFSTLERSIVYGVRCTSSDCS